MMTSQQSTNNQQKSFGMKFQLACKRLIDVAVSLILLVLLLPLFLVIAAFITAEDGRPVFFKQKRSGKGNRTFEIYKFRSMKQPSGETPKEKRPSPYNWDNRVPDDFVFKTASLANPNITKTGAFIRKYSLDELPQFLNVLKGDISLIGPRPEIVEITRCYDEEQRKRLNIKPGVSGLAQVSGRNMNHGEKIRHDLYYIRHFSLWLDVKIFFKTIFHVISGKDAV